MTEWCGRGCCDASIVALITTLTSASSGANLSNAVPGAFVQVGFLRASRMTSPIAAATRTMTVPTTHSTMIPAPMATPSSGPGSGNSTRRAPCPRSR